MRQYLDISAWVIFFALLPVTVLILISQNTVPGDLFYPVKRGMENVVLVAASVSPSTRAAFRTDLTERRFNEAQKLLVTKADTKGYGDFVTEVRAAKKEISSLSNPAEKTEKSQKLLARVQEYKAGLTQVQTQIQTTVQRYQSPVPTPTPSEGPSYSFSPTSTPEPLPLDPTVITIIVNNPEKAQEINQEIDNVSSDLGQIENDLQTQTQNVESTGQESDKKRFKGNDGIKQNMNFEEEKDKEGSSAGSENH